MASRSSIWLRCRLAPSGCWEWMGASAPYREAWSRVHGPIPEGLVIAHRCDNRKCIKPQHLFLTTAMGNCWDSCHKGRHYHKHAVPGYKGRLAVRRAIEEISREAETRAMWLRVIFASLLLRAA